ncbi:MAG: glycosyltransferase family 39 protein, partial [Parcubacteria group bacterium]
MKVSRYFIVLIGLAIVFSFVYSWFAVSVNLPQSNQLNKQMIFSWPDEMASHAFVSRFIDNGSFVMPEPLNAVLNTYVHPRSVNIVINNIVPMGFLGMLIIYGWLGKLFGLTAVMFFTPLIAAIGVLFFYGLIARIFDKRTGFISALLLFCLAPFWYYANLGMLSSVLFVSLLIIGLYFFVKQADHKHHQLLSSVAGLFVGLALTVRLIEFPWVGILILVPTIFYWRKIKWQQIVLFLVGVIIPLVVMLYYNYHTYGRWLTVGYLTMSGLSFFDRLPNEFRVSTVASMKAYLQFIFVPFGFHPRTILVNVYHYIARPLAPYLGLSIVGGLLWVAKFKVQSLKLKANLKFKINSSSINENCKLKIENSDQR